MNAYNEFHILKKNPQIYNIHYMVEVNSIKKIK